MSPEARTDVIYKSTNARVPGTHVNDVRVWLYLPHAACGLLIGVVRPGSVCVSHQNQADADSRVEWQTDRRPNLFVYCAERHLEYGDVVLYKLTVRECGKLSRANSIMCLKSIGRFASIDSDSRVVTNAAVCSPA
jgi:hypothetical protein